MPLFLYTSNRLENLAAAFTELIRDKPLSPLEKETVVLQSGGMARWLSLRSAEDLGISANTDFPFPNSFIDRIFRAVLPEKAIGKRVERHMLKWQLMRLLPELCKQTHFRALSDYLDRDRDLKRYRLAGRLADLFDQYMIFRPEMILEWEAGKGKSWQARLWQELSTREDCLAGVSNRAQLQAECLKILDSSETMALDLPSRFSVFGLSTLPPYYLQLFNGLAEHLDVHFFFLNPCREYWGDIISGKIIDKLGREDISQEDLHLSLGNPLLASTGQQGREMLNMLTECNISEEHELFSSSEPAKYGRKRILEIVQQDVLDLRDGAPVAGEMPGEVDRSIQIHSCHSPMRELEVLHDHLLAMFDEQPGLEPKDIMVMTPDIELYSSLIDAVFSSRTSGSGQKIPFSVADRKLRKEGELVGAFLGILDLAGCRLEIGEVLSALEMEPVRRRFNISLEDLEIIEKWLAWVNIRWGIDAADRQQMGLPATEENTWKAGLDRLLLGYATVGHGSDFAGILPFDDIEGSEVEILGRFLDFTGELFDHVRILNGENTLAEWSEILKGLFSDLMTADDAQEQELKFVFDIINNLDLEMKDSGYAAKVDFEVIKAELVDASEEGGLTTGFMIGGITFCEMLPMRAVPFKVVCLLGMNDAAFPRTTVVPSFDLIGVDPKPGDRSRRKDDRYLFLEAILSARDCLYISYVGQSVRDGSDLLPSVLISEFIEYLGRRFSLCRDELITFHPLQKFSPAYFLTDNALFSYSQSNHSAAQALIQSKSPRIFIPDKLPEPPEEFKRVALDDLTFFFSNTSRAFCQRRLGVFLGGDNGEFNGSEDFDLDPLARFKLGGVMLDKLMAGGLVDDVFRNARQRGIMPHGNIGPAVYKELLEDVEEMADKLAENGAGAASSSLVRSVDIGDFTVNGHIDTSPGNGQYIYRYAQLKATDLVRAWIYHLFLDSGAPAEWSRETHLAGRDKLVSFTPVDSGKELLGEILELYWQGMESALPFFPVTSLALYKSESKGLDKDIAMTKARKKWLGNDFSRGEAEDPYHQLCFSGREPLGDEFVGISKKIFEPLSKWMDQ